MTTLETRDDVGLKPPRSRPRIPSPVGVGAHYNGPPMRMEGKPHDECQARWRGVQNFHMKPKSQGGNEWHDIAYTAAVCHHDTVMEGRGPDVRTAANGTNAANNSYYAIFFMVGGDEVPSQEMLVAADWYARIHLKVGQWRKHADFKPTACAGKVNDQVRDGQLLFFETAEETTPGPKPTPTPTPSVGWTETLVKNLPVVKRRSNLGTSSDWDRRVQGLLVAAGALPLRPNLDRSDRLDGKFGPSTEGAVKDFQRRNRIGVDGIVGRNTWTKLLGR